MKFNPFPWLMILTMLALTFWVRSHLIEQNDLGFFCDSGGTTLTCKIRWLIVQSFHHFGIGYFSFFLGLLAVVTRSGLVALGASVLGVAGLVLYNADYAAVGFLLGVLTLARAQLDDYRAEYRSSQQQA